ncbi:MAG: hypothetical protein EOP85_00225 [Verrucomicrobiaceae bacterium]|nr:MAG: hypothetical protein EOP85_00225 [Verrucomicrobiaceae bacterium]
MKTLPLLHSPLLHTLPVGVILSSAFLPIISSVVSSQTVDTSSREIQVDTSSREVLVDRSSSEIEVDTSTGEVLNSSASPSTPAPQPVPLRMSARIEPVDVTFKAKGEISLSRVGDVMTVTGKIDGLEPTARYHLAIPPVGSDSSPVPAAPSEEAVSPQNDGEQRNDKDLATGAPAAGAPQAGTPNATAPQAGQPDAGKPDGEERQGAPGAGEGTSVTGTPLETPAPETRDAKPGVTADANKMSGLLGIVTADSAGSANIDLTVHSLSLTAGQTGLEGRPVTLTTIPAEEAGSVLVATGMIEAADATASDD